MSRLSRETLGHIAVYGVIGAILTLALQLVEYRWLIIGHSFEVYGALVAALFAAVGIWAGRTLTRARTEVVERHVETVVVREVVVEVPVEPAGQFVRDERQVATLGLTPRELEILEAIAAGLSNREIGERLYVSENTVKTHSSRVFDKLGVQRRVQAVQQGRELRLIP
jgi:NarL family two-component system response regulator LiaR